MSEFYTSFSRNFGKVHVRGYRNGKRFSGPVKYKPFLFVDSDESDSEFRTIHGKPVSKIEFDSIKEWREFVDKYKYIESFNIYGLQLHEYAAINQIYSDDIKWDPKLIRVGNFDIETDSEEGYGNVLLANKAIISIALKVFGENVIYMLGFKEYDTLTFDREKYGNYEIKYFKCRDEAELLERFIKLWVMLDFDVITGWNINMYDVPYVVRRIDQILGPDRAKELSPLRNISKREATVFQKEMTFFTFDGIQTLDYLDVYKKFTFGNDESYKLEYIANKELGVGKLDYSEHKTLANFYKADPDNFYNYNIIDILRVEQIDVKNKFINQICSMAYTGKTNYSDMFATVRPWDIIIHNYLLKHGMVVPSMEDKFKDRQILGAFVKDPIPNRYNWVMSFDFKSLYPHLIMLYNISPETFITQLPDLADPFAVVDRLLGGYLKPYHDSMVKNNFCVTGKGTVFSREKQGFLPALMRFFFNQRTFWSNKEVEFEKSIVSGKLTDAEIEQAKLEQVEAANNSMAIKILLNSMYGALTNEHCRWFSMALGESITLSGQLWIRTVMNAINKGLNILAETTGVDYVLAGDTDSCYLQLDLVVKKFLPDEKDPKVITQWLDAFAKNEMKKILDDAFEELYTETNAFERCMSMARENIAETAIWTGKKHYCMKVRDKKGAYYETPQYKIMGLEAIKSSTPKYARTAMVECIKLILDGDRQQVIDFVEKFKDDYYNLPFDQYATTRGISDVDKYADPVTVFIKGCPITARASLMYNHLLKKHNVETIYQPIRSGDKIKYTYLILPNPIGENVIAASDILPPEFGLEPYIDFFTQYDKVFYKPMAELSAAAGIHLDSTNTLDSLYI